MKIVYNRYIPFKRFLAVNLFGVLFVRLNEDGSKPYISERTINHEMIHTAQMKELLYVFFYLLYFIEWILRLVLPPYKTAYRDVSFEEEARVNEYDCDYLKYRERYSWIKYLF